MQLPMVAPTMAPVEVEFEEEGEGVVAAPLWEEEEDEDVDWVEGVDWSDGVSAVSEEVREEEAVGQPMIVGEVRAQPSMGWAKAWAPLALVLNAPLAVLPSSSYFTTGTVVFEGRSL